jgi:hypothetical protein
MLATGRVSTAIAVARLAGSPAAVDVQHFTVPGNVETEAFFADGSLAVIDYTPPEAPTGYRVRRLDLTTGAVADIDTEDDEDMTGGSARTHVYSPDGKRLYTYYRIVDGEGSRAFIHVLDLEQQTARCVDLPAPFGSTGPNSTALAVSADGAQLFVADAASTAVADVDTSSLHVTRVESDVPRPLEGSVSAAVGGDGTLYVGTGFEVRALDAATLAPRASYPVTDGSVTALRLAPNGAAQLFVGLGGRIAVVDLTAGHEVRSLPSPAASPVDEPITFLGPASPPLPAALSSMQCAC